MRDVDGVQAARRRGVCAASAVILTLLFVGCGVGEGVPASESAQAQSGGRRQATQPQSDSDFEAAQTEKLLGVAVRDFPPPQGVSGLDELGADAPPFRFTVAERRPTGPGPGPSYEPRLSVQARAPDGSVYEALCERNDPKLIVPFGFVSTPDNTRQLYGTHHGYAFSPKDVFVGRREGERLKPVLFFRDVGSHTTAPHHMAVDDRGQVHLAVADVNIFQDNRLDLYWVVGDPASGKWTAAWLIDRRGFTSWSHPWSAAWGDKVHLLWTWCDVSVNKRAPGMGVFHLEWGPGGFGRKVRVASGAVSEWGAAVDPQTGRLLIAFSKDDGVYVTSRPEGGSWTRAARLHARLRKSREVSVEPAAGGAFVVRTGEANTREWLLSPR
jgi:hypothetical protein